MSVAPPGPCPLRVFCSYAHEDDKLRNELKNHLRALEIEGLIAEWHDRRILAGQNWAEVIDAQLEAADIILLLVSADFIASDYCLGKEMKRALERGKAGEAAVIPVILRSARWKKLPLGALQALPRRGKPIEEWKHRDRALLNVVEGVREVAEQRRGDVASGNPAAAAVKRDRRRQRRRLLQGLAVAAATVAVAATLNLWHSAYRRQVALGNSYLNIRRLAEARQAFDRAYRLNWLGRDARLGLSKVETWLAPDKVVFRQKLETLQREQPDDPHVQLLLGNLAFEGRRVGDAISSYENAIAKEPKLAEAHFGLGAIHQARGELRQAIDSYQKAVAASPDTPRYRNNLAYLLARNGRRAEAIDEYLRIDNYPLAQIEVAQLYWAEGAFAQARDHQYRAIAWLQDPTMAELPENRGRWAVEAPPGRIELGSTAKKRCYAELQLAGSLCLLGDSAAAAKQSAAALDTCRPEATDLKRAVVADLERLGREAPPRADAGRTCASSLGLLQ